MKKNYLAQISHGPPSKHFRLTLRKTLHLVKQLLPLSSPLTLLDLVLPTPSGPIFLPVVPTPLYSAPLTAWNSINKLAWLPSFKSSTWPGALRPVAVSA